MILRPFLYWLLLTPKAVVSRDLSPIYYFCHNKGKYLTPTPTSKPNISTETEMSQWSSLMIGLSCGGEGGRVSAWPARIREDDNA